MLNNQQRHYVSKHGLYPQYPFAPSHRYDFGFVDSRLNAYGRDVHQSLYVRDDFAHLAPQQFVPAQQPLSSALAPSYITPAFEPYEHNLSHRTRQLQRPVYQSAIECPQPIMDAEQLAHIQGLSASYEPEVNGPLASEILSSKLLVDDYAQADPVYQAKSLSLASTYPHIRTMRGDGSCGWRAVAFGYFERLVASRNPTLLLREEARLTSLINVVKNAGFDTEMYDEFACESIRLMRDLSTGMRNGTATSILLDRFNDDQVQNYVITHMKILTTSWLKTHVNEYSDFIIKESLDSYCEQQIMPVKSEIDQVGLMALKDVLLAPADIGLEVEYLDLSPGQDGTLHIFTNVNQSVDLGVQRLLYRPGHYDILYKAEDLAVPQVSAYFQFGTPTSRVMPVLRSDIMHVIPGMSTVPPGQCGWQGANHFDDLLGAPVSQPMIVPTTIPIVPPRAPLQPLRQAPYIAPQLPQNMTSQHNFHDSLYLDPSSIQTMSTQPQDKFRMNYWHHKQVNEPVQAQFQTAQFKNSHFNRAHYDNEHFQPEAWSPNKEQEKNLEETFVEIEEIAKSGRHKRAK